MGCAFEKIIISVLIPALFTISAALIQFNSPIFLGTLNNHITWCVVFSLIIIRFSILHSVTELIRTMFASHSGITTPSGSRTWNVGNSVLQSLSLFFFSWMSCLYLSQACTKLPTLPYCFVCASFSPFQHTDNHPITQ